MRAVYRDRIEFIFLIIAVAFVAQVAVGLFRTYSPVPVWDMWDGYLDFYTKITHGDWSAWWAQHNEHRIVLARLLFWADLTWFRGEGWFLLFMNFLFLCAIGATFWKFWREAAGTSHAFVGYFLIAWLFSWVQHENITWEFQSQFFLAQLLPLWGVYLLHRARFGGARSAAYFAGACVVGVLAVGSMANGVLALPLMAIYALLTRQGWRRCILLGVLALFCLWLYLHDYRAPADHGSLFLTIQANPFNALRFILLYLGGPFYFAFGGGGLGKVVAYLAGAALVAGSALAARHYMGRDRHSTLSLAMLFFILYIGGTALVTAGGRLFFGLDSALSSRYMTPALMAWAALLIVNAEVIKGMVSNVPWKICLLFFVLIVLLLPIQMRAWHSRHEGIFENEVAALALEMRIDDKPQIERLWFNSEATLAISAVPSDYDWSVFGWLPIHNVRETIGAPYDITQKMVLRSCNGVLDDAHVVDGDPRYIKIHGWYYDPLANVAPKSLGVVNGGQRVGHVLLGQPRPDVAKIYGRRAANSGFKGYVLAKARGERIELIDEANKCRLSVDIPR